MPEKSRWGAVLLLVLACLGCPGAIVWLGETYGFDRLPSDYDFHTWPLDAINALFFAELFCAGALVWATPGVRWVSAIVAVAFVAVTAVLAVTGSMWVEGDYF